LIGTAVDTEKHPMAGVDIMLVRDADIDGRVPVLGRSTTDTDGRFQIEGLRAARNSGSRNNPFLCAYQPGAALVSLMTIRPADPQGFRLEFAQAEPRTVKIANGDGRPMRGVRIAPLIISVKQAAPGIAPAGLLPDELVERVATTTGEDGVAAITCLSPA